MDDFEEEEDGHPISQKDISETIKKNNGFTTPRLNDVLFLNFKSISRITNLDPFVNLKTLWLNNNAISKIENLGELKHLKCLYLQSNIIENIEGLEMLVELETLVLSHNYISKVEGLSKLIHLTDLHLDHNRLRTLESIRGLTEVPSVNILNLQQNNISSDDFILVTDKLPNLRVLRMDGNPVTRSMQNYRRQLIVRNKHLQYLDDAPIEDNDRRIAEAWSHGGHEAEVAEREAIKEEKRKRDKENIREFNRLQREALIAAGQSLKEHQELFSSDDENEIIPKKQEDEKNENFFSEIDEIENENPKECSVKNSKNSGEEEEKEEPFIQINHKASFTKPIKIDTVTDNYSISGNIDVDDVD